MRLRRNNNGFTLAELLVALMVTSIIFTAVFTLSYAIGSANDSTDDTNQKQAQVRYAMLRAGEVIKHSKLVYKASSGEVIFWNKDSNNDGQINDDELVYIDSLLTDEGYQLRIREGVGSPVVMVSQCSGVQFLLDVAPPQSRYVGISFGLFENGVVRQYEISGVVRGWAGNLLDKDGNIVSDDD